ncbi:MAG TPA: hypothetical protein VF074_09405, partial [Pyrinomonadaceae bacterium]
MKRVPHRSEFNHHPLAAVASSFSIGILGSTVLPQNPTFLLITVGIFTICSVIALRINRLRIAGVVLLIAFSFAGATLTVLEKRVVDPWRVRELIDRGVIR